MLASTPASAQEWFAPGYFDNWAFNNQAAEMLRRSQKHIFLGGVVETLRRQQPADTPLPPAPTITQDQVQGIANQLSSSFAGDDRIKARRIFVELYSKYRQLERQLGVRPSDPAGATAALIAASYMAYADADLGERVAAHARETVPDGSPRPHPRAQRDRAWSSRRSSRGTASGTNRRREQSTHWRSASSMSGAAGDQAPRPSRPPGIAATRRR